MYKVKAASKHTIFVNDIDVILYDVVYVNIKKPSFENSKDIQTLINSKKIEYTSFFDPSDIENSGNISLNDSTISLSETWSSSKIKLEIDNVKPNVDVSAGSAISSGASKLLFVTNNTYVPKSTFYTLTTSSILPGLSKNIANKVFMSEIAYGSTT